MSQRDLDPRPPVHRLATHAVAHGVALGVSLVAAGCASPSPDGASAQGSTPSGGGEHRSSQDPLPAPTADAITTADLPDPEMFTVASSSFWRSLDDEAVRRYATANERRIVASRMKDAAAVAAAANEYDRYFSLHRKYHERYIQAEAIERMTALGIKVGTSIRP